MMNKKAAALGLTSTRFENTNGLDDTANNHVTSARDIAIMSRELMKHEKIFDYTTVWMDTVRGGEFGLSNTNRLLRTYSGCTGLKTGSTAKAKFCISATACRDDLHLIAVIMGAPTRDIRNEAAKKLLDYGFANYSVFRAEGGSADDIKVVGGTEPFCKTGYEPFTALLKKGENSQVKSVVEPYESMSAPVAEGDVAGKVTYRIGDRVIGSVDIVCSENVDKIGFKVLLYRMLGYFTLS